MSKSPKSRKEVTSRNPENITEYLTRMHSDVQEISRRLTEAPVGLTGQKEPKLWKLCQKIEEELKEAQRLWNG